TAIQLDNLTLAAELDNWSAGTPPTLDLRGQARVTLPAAVQPMLAGTLSGQAQITLHHQGAGLSEAFLFAIVLSGLQFKPDANPLALGSASLALTLARTGSGPWNLTFSAEAIQSWTQVARNLRARNIVSLPAGSRFPDLHCTFALTLTSGTWKI